MMPFRPVGQGTVAVSFTKLESQLITDLATQISDLLSGSVAVPADSLLASVGIGGGDALSTDPAVARLLPDAYGDDSEASIEFRRLTEHSLAGRKVANAHLVTAALLAAPGDEIELDAPGQQAWLRTLTDIRLVIAARLGIESDEDRGRQNTEDDLMMLEVYDWLAMVQGSLLEAMES